MLRALARTGGRADVSDGLEAIDAKLDAPGDQALIAQALQELAAIDREAILLFVRAGSEPVSAAAVSDLPDPDAPTRATASPGAMDRETSLITGRFPI